MMCYLCARKNMFQISIVNFINREKTLAECVCGWDASIHQTTRPSIFDIDIGSSRPKVCTSTQCVESSEGNSNKLRKILLQKRPRTRHLSLWLRLMCDAFYSVYGPRCCVVCTRRDTHATTIGSLKENASSFPPSSYKNFDFIDRVCV